MQSEIISHLQSKLIELSPNDEVMAPRRSLRVHRYAISYDYIVYLTKSDFDVKLPKDPIIFSQVTS